MYTAKRARNGSPCDRTVADTPRIRPISVQRRHARLGVPQQQRGGQDEQELEQHVAEDQVLELDLEAVVQHRDRGQGGDPGPDAEPVPGQRVHHDTDGQAHQVLQDRYCRIAVQRLEDLQEHRVAGRPRHVRVQADHVAHVYERVVEPDLPLIAELGVHAQQERGDQDQDEQPVLGAHGRGAAPGRAGPAGTRGSGPVPATGSCWSEQGDARAARHEHQRRWRPPGRHRRHTRREVPY